MMKLVYCKILEGKYEGICTGMVERLDVEENYTSNKRIKEIISKYKCLSEDSKITSQEVVYGMEKELGLD